MATVLTNAGKGIITNRLKGSGTEPNFIGWGTGAGTAAVGDTTLFTEVTDTARATGTSTRIGTNSETYQVVGLITATTTRAITNSGLFDAVTVGNLFVKGDFATINLVTGDSIQFTYQVTFA